MKDLYIQVLEFFEQRPNGVTLDDLMDELKFDAFEERFFRDNINTERLFQYVGTRESKTASGQETHHNLYFLSIEDRYKLVEFRELEEARENSREAKFLSIFAIIISISAIIIQFF